MANLIKCPHCKANFEISEAFKHEIEETITQSLEEKYQRDLKNALEKEKAQYIKSVGKDLEEEKLRNKKLAKQLDELLDEIRILKRKDEDREIEMKKRIIDEEDKIRKDAINKEKEASTLVIAELNKKISDMQRALDEAKEKGNQKSQQLQGEVLELDLESKLRNAFSYDEINPVGKGVQGADIIQTVKNQVGKTAGKILWETKRAKWTPVWIAKLKEDGRKNDATLVVLACENLPDSIQNFAMLDGVIVTSHTHCLSLATILRRNLMLIAQAKSASESKDERLEMLYSYIQSDAFRHRFEAFSDGIAAMEADLLTERRSMERIWKKRETELKRMQLNTSRMFGELQGVMENNLPTIKSLELESGDN